MSKHDVEEVVRLRVVEIISDIAHVEPGEITGDMDIADDLDIDLSSLVVLAERARDEYKLEIPDSDFPLLRTVRDIVRYVLDRYESYEDAIRLRIFLILKRVFIICHNQWSW